MVGFNIEPVLEIDFKSPCRSVFEQILPESIVLWNCSTNRIVNNKLNGHFNSLLSFKCSIPCKNHHFCQNRSFRYTTIYCEQQQGDWGSDKQLPSRLGIFRALLSMLKRLYLDTERQKIFFRSFIFYNDIFNMPVQVKTASFGH